MMAGMTPTTQAGKGLLNDIRAVWGVPTWQFYPWENDVRAIEAEARADERERIRERLLGEDAPVDALYERFTKRILDEEAAR